MTSAPRAGQATFNYLHEIYYTTDDGYAQLLPRHEARHDAAHIEGLYSVFERFEEFHRRVTPARRERIHLASVIGGLYGLNLIPIFRPREITFFDVNPHAIEYFEMIRRVWIDSPTADAFLGRLANADYEVRSEREAIIRRCIAKKQKGVLPEREGRSGRSFLSSWRYALDHFDLTRGLLADVPINTRVEAMHAQSFKDFVAGREDLWIYCSNVLLFVFFDLTFHFPENAALFASYFEKTDMLDLGTAATDSMTGPVTLGPVTVHCRIPLTIAQ
jgi:hypothetical protein